MILSDQITWCCSHQEANPSLTSQTAGLVIPTSSKTRYDCTLPFVWTDVVPKYLGLGRQEETTSLEDRQVNFINFFFIIPKNHFEVSLFFPTSLCGVLVFDSVSLPLLRPLLLFVNHHLCHTIFVPHHLSHTSLSHTICHRHLCQPPSFTHDLSPHLCHTPSVTHIFVNHHLSHTPSFTRIFVTHHLSHTSLSTTIFVTHTPSVTHIFVNHHLCHTISHTHLCHTPSVTQIFVNHHLCHTIFVTHHLSHTSLSTTIFHTPSFTHIFVTQHLSHRSLSTTIFVTPSLSHTISHTHLCRLPSFTHHLSHTSFSHTICHTHLCQPPSLSHHLSHTSLSHTRRGTWWHPFPFHVAGATLGDTNLRFAWQAWHFGHWAGSGGWIGRRWRRGTLRGRRGTCWHPLSFHLAGVALGDIHLRFAWQAWHLAMSAFVSRGRCGTWWYPPPFRVASVALRALGWLWWCAWTGLVAGDATAFCVAGVALGDIHLRFTWQVWHLVTSTFVLRRRRGT